MAQRKKNLNTLALVVVPQLLAIAFALFVFVIGAPDAIPDGDSGDGNARVIDGLIRLIFLLLSLIFGHIVSAALCVRAIGIVGRRWRDFGISVFAIFPLLLGIFGSSQSSWAGALLAGLGTLVFGDWLYVELVTRDTATW